MTETTHWNRMMILFYGAIAVIIGEIIWIGDMLMRINRQLDGMIIQLDKWGITNGP